MPGIEDEPQRIVEPSFGRVKDGFSKIARKHGQTVKPSFWDAAFASGLKADQRHELTVPVPTASGGPLIVEITEYPNRLLKVTVQRIGLELIFVNDRLQILPIGEGERNLAALMASPNHGAGFYRKLIGFAGADSRAKQPDEVLNLAEFGVKLIDDNRSPRTRKRIARN